MITVVVVVVVVVQTYLDIHLHLTPTRVSLPLVHPLGLSIVIETTTTDPCLLH
jgi:hypothetical protein